MKERVTMAILAAAMAAASVSWADDQARPQQAQAYRAGGEAVIPAADGNIFCEAEEFRIATPGWQAGYWGQNYYAATFANTFLSRKAFLGAPEDCDETVATINVDVKTAGKYLVLVRYEAAYRFETQFRVKVEQGGETRLDRLYGARRNLKIWAFGSKLKDEVAWPWGAVENVVWEGHDAYVELQPGSATISLTAGHQPAPQAKRNVDLVMLTQDEDQVRMRIEKEGYLPLDGMLTQAGDVFLKIRNTGADGVTVKSLGFPGGPMQQHSPYWTHIRNWQPLTVEIAGGATSEWLDVGGTMDTLNDGQWGFSTSGACQLEFGVSNAAGTIESVRTFDVNGNLPLVSWADSRYSHKFQTPDEATQELFAYLKSLSVPGKRISRTRVDATGGLPQAVYDFYGFNLAIDGVGVYDDCRSLSLAQLQDKYGDKMSEAQRAAILIMSLGDEIGLPQPDAQAAGDGFVAYLKAQGLTPSQVDPAAGDDWAKVIYSADEKLRESNASRFYWSRRFLYHYGIQAIKTRTDLLRQLLPNAHIGANFSPHHGGGEHTFLGETFKWVTCFREQGMILPWSEDYIWQVPVGTPQMNGISLDLFRAGLRGQPERKILYYVMPHMPGNTPAMWRRLWYNAIGHGAKILNLFEFDPVWVAYTENHVTGKAMYAEVLRAMRQLGLYEDIIQDGQVRPAEVALWFSETGDIWRDNLPSFGAAKRALYIAILDRGVPLDFVVEQDAADGTLANYKVLYLTDNHVSRAASAAIAAWVGNGGKLFATAGAGMFDEYGQPNATLRELLGVAAVELVRPAADQVHFVKQDLRFVQPLGQVRQADDSVFPVFGVTAKITPSAGVAATATFADGTPALLARTAGKGEVLCCAFLPGLSYFHPATPLKPLDRGSTDDAMSHFIPTAFDANVGALIGSPLRDVLRPAVADQPLVETNVIMAGSGTAIVLQNWSGAARPGLQLTVCVPVPGASAALAGGGTVTVEEQGDSRQFRFDLDVSGDVLILR